MIRPVFTLEEYGPEPDGLPVLSVGIPTCDRAPELRRFLGILAGMIGASRHRGRVDVVISNNASPDDTSAVIREMLPAFESVCRVRVFTQHHNIGGEPNFRFIYEHSRADYVWLCSDRDFPHPDQLDPLIDDLDRYRPCAAISSFVNFATDKDLIRLPGGADVAVVTDEVEAARAAWQYGKITQFVLRRDELTPEEQAFSETASEGRVWFAALALMLFLRHEQRLLLRAGVLAHSDSDALNLMFSARVYAGVRDYILAAVGDHPRRAEIEAALPVINVWHPVVGHLFRNSVGVSRMKLEEARSDYLYARANLRAATFASWRNAVKMPFILLLFPVVYRWRRLREAKR